MGIPWPGLMEPFSEVFGFPFVLEGYAFFIEAIFVGIYLFGWNRMSPRAHMLSAFPMIISGTLGAFFVIFQGREWVALLAQGLTLTSSPYGGFFYVIVGVHALHAIAALGGLVWAWTRLRAGRLAPTQLWTVETFWFFVVLVWPMIYLRVYL